MSTDRSTIAASVASACTESAGTVQALAEEVGVSYAALCSWSRGRRRPPPHRLLKLAAVLDVRAERLRELADQLRAQAGEAAGSQPATAAPVAARLAAEPARPAAAPERGVIPLAAAPRTGGGAADAQSAPGAPRHWSDAASDSAHVRRPRAGAIPLPPQDARR